VENISGDGVKNASFEVKKGEVLGIGGMVGSKRTEIMRLLFGAGKLESGAITYHGKSFKPVSPYQMLKEGFCFITEDRAISGLLLSRNIKENMLICKYSKQKVSILNMKNEEKIVNDEMSKLDIKARSYRQLIKYLSGGNQQKVILAKWLLTQGEIFLMDEPTRGIDIATKEDVYKLIVEIVRRGGSVILVSSDMLELVSLSDRIIVMKDGNQMGELSLNEISEENILKLAVGG